MKQIILILLTLISSVSAHAQDVVYYHTDALGSPAAITDANGNVIERSEYEPYGLLLNRVLADGPGYAGQVSDAASRMSYMDQRYFDPELGNFISVDPVSIADNGDPRSFNRYSYAFRNPYRFIDPDGRESWSITGSSNVLPAMSEACGGDNGCMREAGGQLARAELEMTASFIPAERLLMLGGNVLRLGIQARRVERLVAAANVEFRNGLSVAARKIESHSQRIGGTWGKLTGTVAEKNAQAEKMVRSVLSNKNAVREELAGGGFEIRVGKDGQGIRFNKDGSFNTVLDPRKVRE